MSEPHDRGPWDETPVHDDRPNLLAVLSVLSGALGIAALSLWCLGLPLLITNLTGAFGLITGVAARRQAVAHGYGNDYALWGITLGVFNLGISILIGVLVGLSL